VSRLSATEPEKSGVTISRDAMVCITLGKPPFVGDQSKRPLRQDSLRSVGTTDEPNRWPPVFPAEGLALTLDLTTGRGSSPGGTMRSCRDRPARLCNTRHRARVARRARELQAAGVTATRAIAKALNARGVRTARGGGWHHSTRRNLLMGDS